MKLAMSRTWAEINLDALEYNINILKNLLNNKVKILGVCKGNAYGHGILQIAKKLQELKIHMIGVSSLQEGIKLRKNGIIIPILCLGQSNPEFIDLIIKYDITQVIENLEFGKAFSQKALGKRKMKAHVTIDTGMGRIGFFWPKEGDCNNDEKKAISNKILELCKLEGLEIEGIFTHFANADNKEYTYSQIKKFNEVLDYMKKEGINFKITHAAASVGTLKYPDAHFGKGRFGLTMYGYASNKTGNKESDLKFMPLMTLKSRISTVRKLPKGSNVGYECTYELKRDSIIAVVPFGYADGFPRTLSNKANVKIHNKLCPILGCVCMDNIMVDVSDFKDEIKAGDIAIVLDEELLIENAKNANTIIHELLSQISPSINRIYINKNKLSL